VYPRLFAAYAEKRRTAGLAVNAEFARDQHFEGGRTILALLDLLEAYQDLVEHLTDAADTDEIDARLAEAESFLA